MKMSHKALSLALCLALLLAAVSCAFAEEAQAQAPRRIRLGSSAYSVELDPSYKYAEIPEEEGAEYMTLSLYNLDNHTDIEVYQFPVEDTEKTLAQYTEETTAEATNVTELVTDDTINGIPVAHFRGVVEYADVSYNIIDYIMADDGGFVEVLFWMESELGQPEGTDVMSTLKQVEVEPTRLGTSAFWVIAPTDLREAGMTSEGVADGQVASWISDEAGLMIDVYQFDKGPDPTSVAEYVTWEAEDYDNVGEIVPEASINGLSVGWYRTVEERDGKELPTISFVALAGDEFVEIVFWLEGPNAAAEADAIMKSLWMEGEEENAAEDEPASKEDLQAQLDALLVQLDELYAKIEAQEAAEAEAAPAEEPAEAETAEETADAEAVEPEPDTDTEEAAAPELTQLRLGTTLYTVQVPAAYTEGKLTDEDIADDQVGYYYSEDSLMDFDVYQFSKDGYPDDLAEYTKSEVEGYTAVSELVLDGEINGYPVCWYRTVEEYDEAEYNTLTYILDAGDEYVDVVFWLDGENAEAEAAAIINTLHRDDLPELPPEAMEDAQRPPEPPAEAPAQEGAEAAEGQD